MVVPRELDEAEIARILARGAVYRSIVVVRATRVSNDSTWTTSGGDALTAKAGDWWVMEGDDRWSVSHHIFTQTYESLGENRYQKCATVTAVPIDRPFAVQTPEGVASGEAGDWLVQNPTGECWPVNAAVFARRYEPVAGMSGSADAPEVKQISECLPGSEN